MYTHNYNDWYSVLIFGYGEETDGQSYSLISWFDARLILYFRSEEENSDEPYTSCDDTRQSHNVHT